MKKRLTEIRTASNQMVQKRKDIHYHTQLSNILKDAIGHTDDTGCQMQSSQISPILKKKGNTGQLHFMF